MDQQRWQQIEALFQQASELAPDQRASLLAHACDGDVELRREVEALLKDESRINSFLKEPAIARVASEFAAAESLCGQRIGHYEMRALLGQGGMGAVWKAWDDNLKREVAIKILPQEFAADPERIARFQQEARAASALKHPNIITIHEVGQVTMPHGELYFIVTEFIEGQTLRDYLAQPDRNWRVGVRIATQIASALSAAHTADLIHRDIKPENIMVQTDGGVKVLDFGIAKLSGGMRDEGEGMKEGMRDVGGGMKEKQPNTEAGREQQEADDSTLIHPSSLIPHPSPLPHPSLTAPGARLGTIRYMSPEQARGETLDVRTDIFSLGVVLYELLVGQRPYGNVPDDEMMQQLMDVREIAPVSQLLPNIPAALDRIVTRALRKKREERYASASEMLSDLQQLRINREEKGLQCLRTQSANQMLTQFVVRYDEDRTTRIPLGGLWTIGRFADLQRGKLEREVLSKSRWSVLRRLGGLALVIAAMTLLMAAWASVTEAWEEKVLRDGHTAAVRQAVFSPDGKRLVSVSEDKRVIVWDFQKRERLATLNVHQAEVIGVAFAPDGQRFATQSRDGVVIVWDAVQREKITEWRDYQRTDAGIAFSPDGRLLANTGDVGTTDIVVLRDTVNWERVTTLSEVFGRSLIFSPNSRQLLLSSDEAIYDLLTGQQLVARRPDGVNWMALSPDARRLAAINAAGEVALYQLPRPGDLTQRKLLHHERTHDDHGRSIAFSPDGRLLASAAEHVVLWNAAAMQREAVLKHSSIVWCVAFSPDGRWLVSTHGDGSILVWDVQTRDVAANFNEHGGPVRAVAFTQDGHRIVTAGDDRTVIVWNAATTRKETVLNSHESRINGVAISSAGEWLAAAEQGKTLKLWDVTQRHLQWQAKDDGVSAYCAAVSPDGRWVATTFGVYERATGRQVVDLTSSPTKDWGQIYGVAFSADERRLVCVSDIGAALLWNTDTWRLLARQNQSGLHLISVSFAPDGQTFVTGEDEGTLRLWRTEPLAQIAVLGKHDARIKSVAFSPDGTQVVSAGDDKTIALWDVGSRRLVTRIGLHTSPVYAVAWSPDGQQLVSGEHDHSVRLYARRRSLWGWSLD